MTDRIAAALTALETRADIRVLLAVESGSRAWGFPSPDSDYDVRLVYCHRPAWYLTLDEGRDTIEQPVDDLLDLSGWELRKFLRLLRAGNATPAEWLQSAVIYHQTPAADTTCAPSCRPSWPPRWTRFLLKNSSPTRKPPCRAPPSSRLFWPKNTPLAAPPRPMRRPSASQPAAPIWMRCFGS